MRRTAAIWRGVATASVLSSAIAALSALDACATRVDLGPANLDGPDADAATLRDGAGPGADGGDAGTGGGDGACGHDFCASFDAVDASDGLGAGWTAFNVPPGVLPVLVEDPVRSPPLAMLVSVPSDASVIQASGMRLKEPVPLGPTRPRIAVELDLFVTAVSSRAGTFAFVLTLPGPDVSVGIEAAGGGVKLFVFETPMPKQTLGIVPLNEWVHVSLFVAPRSSESDLPRVTVKASTFEVRDYVLEPQAFLPQFTAEVQLYTTGGEFSANIDNVTMDWK